jgi:hypothetical protein
VQLYRDYFANCFAGTDEGAEALFRIAYTHLNTPSGVWLYRPVRYIAVSRRIVSLQFLPGGVVDLSRIELE